MHCCVLQLNMHVFPTPVRTEARVTKSRAGLSASVHQAGRAPLVLKVRKPSVHLPVCLFLGSICSVWRPSYRPRLEHRHPSPPQHVSRCCCQCAAWLLVMLGCVRYMAGEADLGSTAGSHRMASVAWALTGPGLESGDTITETGGICIICLHFEPAFGFTNWERSVSWAALPSPPLLFHKASHFSATELLFDRLQMCFSSPGCPMF